MKVLFQTRTNLFDAPGGDMVQMLKTKEYLEKIGVEVDISLEFSPDLSDYDLVHLFNLMEPQDIYPQMLNARRQNKKVVLSTIYGLYTEFERKARGGVFQKLANFLSPYQIGYIKTVIKQYKEKRMHDGVYQMLRKGYYGLMKEIVDNTSVFLPNSTSEMDRVAKEFKLTNYEFESIPNAIDKTIFNDQVEIDSDTFAKYGQFKDCIFCAARIEGRKSTLNLVQAVKDLPYKLVLAGNESKNQKQYVDAVHAAAGANVHFLGAVPHNDLAALYKLAKVHALVSWMETPGLSSLEAGAMDCNLVITDKGDTREYFGDLAFYCEPDDVNSIQTAIDAAYKSPVDSALKNRINNNFHWEVTAEKTLAGYKRAMADN